jgi:putative two-component system response regulator
MNQTQKSLLIVDDERVVRKILCDKLSGTGYQCQEASNAAEALEKLQDSPVDMVILDIKMPGKSGTELLPEIKAKYPDTAVIMATAIAEASVAITCMKNGAYDYLTKPFNLDEVVLSVGRALEKRRLELENRAYQLHLERMVEQRTEELQQAISNIKLASLDTIHRLAQAAEYKDEGTGAHIKRIGQYSASVAHHLGLSDKEVESILYAAPMHDIGKIGIPDHILLKPGKLSWSEWKIMKQHTIIGAQILQGSDAEFIKVAKVIALTHHEKWDGTGYPRGLKRLYIPLPGRIVAVADVFDALTSERPYREPLSLEESFDTIEDGRRSHFDPDVVDAFFAAKGKILSIRNEYRDERQSRLIHMAGQAVWPRGVMPTVT